MLLAAGEQHGTEDALQEANQAGRALGNGWLATLADYHLGQLARRRDEARRAEDHHHEALALRARMGFHPGTAESQEALATLVAEHELR